MMNDFMGYYKNKKCNDLSKIQIIILAEYLGDTSCPFKVKFHNFEFLHSLSSWVYGGRVLNKKDSSFTPAA